MGNFDHRRARDIIADLLDQRTTDDFPAATLATKMLELIEGEYASFVDVEVGRPLGSRLGYAPYEVRDRLPSTDLHSLYEIHPVHRYYPTSLSLKPERVTDIVSPLMWRQSQTCRDLFSYLGVRYQLIIPLAVSGHGYRLMNIYRGTLDFNDSERDLAAHVQPVLIGLYALAAHTGPVIRANIDRGVRPLTHRELKVLQLVADGRTSHAIAHRLGISAHTVGRHIEAIYAKLGTHDRATTVLRAHHAGLLAS